jgi:hypothetical protein
MPHYKFGRIYLRANKLDSFIGLNHIKLKHICQGKHMLIPEYFNSILLNITGNHLR